MVEIEPSLEGKLVENLLFMSNICSNKSKRIVQTETLLFLRNMAETRLPLTDSIDGQKIIDGNEEYH